jgi:hypothetical protein
MRQSIFARRAVKQEEETRSNLLHFFFLWQLFTQIICFYKAISIAIATGFLLLLPERLIAD